MPSWVPFFICLMSSHVLGDFLLQTDWMARNKNKTSILIFHAIKHGAVAYILCIQWHLLILPLIVGVTHGIVYEFITKLIIKVYPFHKVITLI